MSEYIVSCAQEICNRLAAVVGKKNVLSADEDQSAYVVDWRGRFRGRACAVVKPACVDDVSRIVKVCAEEDISVVPQGGNTGLCGGATPDNSERNVVVRLDRMKQIRDISLLANTITVEAGCILAEIQHAAASVNRYFPLSLGAEGSCQIGGNIATNAGGTGVLRYGPMRDLVLGIEAVLPDGQIFNGLRALRKNATGYDLKQLFIGAEGTLGIITAAVLKLHSLPCNTALALVMLDSVDEALRTMQLLRDCAGENLSNLEIMSKAQIDVIAETMPDTVFPFSAAYPWYLIVQLADSRTELDLREMLENALFRASEIGVIENALIASSESQAQAIWAIRHSVPESNRRSGYVISHDSVVPLEEQARFVANVEQRIKAATPYARVVMHGHIGDGNIHVGAIVEHSLVVDASRKQAITKVINEIVDDETVALGGVLSAEHGIGIVNRDRFERVTDPVERRLMMGLKALLDPKGVMNPGKIFNEDRRSGQG